MNANLSTIPQSNKLVLTVIRTYFEASLPAWLALVAWLYLSRAVVEGNLGYLNLLIMVFPGIWGGLRLPSLPGSWLRKTLACIAFSFALGAGVALVILVALMVLRTVGLHSGLVDNLTGKLLVFGLIPAAVFLVARGIRALPGIMEVSHDFMPG